MEIRKGGPGDASVMPAMPDGAVEWPARNGRTGQRGDERLVGYYRRQGFEPAAEFTVGDWSGRLLSQRLPGLANPSDGAQPGSDRWERGRR